MQAAIPRLCTLLNIKLRLLPMLYEPNRTPLTSTKAAAMLIQWREDHPAGDDG